MTEQADRVYPLTREQEAIWLNDVLGDGRSRYTMLWAHRLTGPLDAAALATAVERTIARHPALHSRYLLHDGAPAQVIGDPADFPVRRENTAADGLPARLAELAAAELDPATDGPVRAVLLTATPEHHVLTVLLHHLVMDGWSLTVLARDIAHHYTELTGATVPPLPAPASSMGEYAVAQRAHAVDPAALAYWRERLADAPDLTTIRPDGSRPAELSAAGARVSFTLGATIGADVAALAKACRTTGFTVLAAITAAWLYRHGGQRDLVLGTPVSRRGPAELDEVVGCLTDLLPVRLSVDPGMTFLELVAAAKTRILAMQRHRDVPFATLVRETVTCAQLDRFPLFQLVLGVDENADSTLELSGVDCEQLEVHPGTAKFDLLLRLTGDRGGYLGMLDYATDLYGEATATRLVERFRTLLASALSRPDQPLDDLDLLPPDELELVTRVWAQAPPPDREPLLAHEAFVARCALTPDATAVLWGEKSMTYRELDEASRRLAARLTEGGARPRTVGILLERSFDMVVAVLATLRAGAAYVPLDPTYPAERLSFMAEDSGLACLLTQSSLRAAVTVPDGVLVLESADWPTTGDAGSDLPVATAADLAFVIYTSGSTGHPKGVAMPHGPLAGLVDWQCGDSGCGPGDRTLQFSALSFDASFLEIFATFATGGALVLIDAEARTDYDQLLETIHRHEVRRMFLPFVALQSIAFYVTAMGLPAPPLREFVCAGEQIHVTPAIREFFAMLDGATLFNQYGPTETHSVSSLRMDGDPEDWPLRPAIGYPINSAHVTVLDERLRPVPAGVPGELCVSGRPLSDGYLGRPDLTAERFVPNPLPHGGPLLYRTGDLARFLPDGRIEFLGRRDGMVKVRGYRVELGEVEARVRSVPGVSDAVVTAETPGVGDTRLVAYYRGGADGPPEPARLRAALATQLPEYMLPSLLVPVTTEFPRTPSGKVDRRALAGMRTP